MFDNLIIYQIDAFSISFKSKNTYNGNYLDRKFRQYLSCGVDG